MYNIPNYMKYIKLFENSHSYSVYDIIVMNPDEAGRILLESIRRQDYDIEIIRDILEYTQIDVNISYEGGWTALMFASSYGHTELVELLFEFPDLDINKASNRGYTALMFASANNHQEIVRMLLERPDIDRSITNENGLNAWDQASYEVRSAFPKLHPKYL